MDTPAGALAKRWYWLVVIIALGWPFVHLAVAYARSGRLPPGGIPDAFVFFPMGAISACVLTFFLWRAKSHKRRTSTALGYLFASPCAFVGSLMSGLMVTQPTGTLIYGAVPLVIGTVIGYAIGRMWDD